MGAVLAPGLGGDGRGEGGLSGSLTVPWVPLRRGNNAGPLPEMALLTSLWKKWRVVILQVEL